MTESYDGTSRPINMIEHPSRMALARQDHQMQLSSDNFPSIPIDQSFLPRSPSPTHASLNEGLTMSAPSAHLFTTAPVLRENEPGCVPYSLRTSQSSRRQILQEFSCSGCKEDCSSFGRNNYSARPLSLLEHPPSALQSYNATAPSSQTKAYTVDNPKVNSLIEDDMLKNTIPVVRDVLQGAVKGLDAYLPQDDTVVKSAPQLDARGSSFTDVGRDQHQHYHFHVPACPHASSSTTRHRAETANATDIGLEPDAFAPLLERGYRLMISARTFIATSIAAVIAQFDL